MATQKDIESFYDRLGYFHTLRMNGNLDYTAAFFDGDFTKTLDEAQSAKHQWVLSSLGFQPGHRILDIGCGWGPMLKVIKARGGTGVGLTLSSNQRDYCVRNGLDARLIDYKAADPDRLGRFDGICCIGAMEHFCSVDEYLAGRQDEIYRQFFAFCASLLNPGGRLFVQSGLFGKRALDPRHVTAKAPPDSDERICYRLCKLYKGSWLPASLEYVKTCAAECFILVESKNGRQDYIETLNRWGQTTRNLFRPPVLWRTIGKLLALTPYYLIDGDFRVQVSSVLRDDQLVFFKREAMTHERMVFERK